VEPVVESIRRWAEAMVKRTGGVRRFEVYDLQLQRSSNGVIVAEFRVESDSKNQNIDGRYRLHLRSAGDVWRVHSQERVDRHLAGRGG
jgi:hypothetical protein